MAEFTLDTSGHITWSKPDSNGLDTSYTTVWSDLSPFAQGYVEALFASLATEPFTNHPHLQREGVCYGETIVGFQDLAPETLAAILTDCEAYPRLFTDHEPSKYLGECVWADRQSGKAAEGFPPLTVYLGDDGKVCTRPA